MNNDPLDYFKELVWKGVSRNAIGFSRDKALTHFKQTKNADLLEAQLAFLEYIEEVFNDIEEDVLNGTYFEGENDE